MPHRKRRLVLSLALLLSAVLVVLIFFPFKKPGLPLEEIALPQGHIPSFVSSEGPTILDSREYPWSAMGRLNISGQGFCNAVLLGPDVAITQASCLYNKREGRLFNPPELHFIAAYQRDQSDLNAAVSSVEIAQKFDPKSKNLANLTHNWALLRLAAPLGQKAGWLGVTEANSENTFILPLGYRRGWGHALAFYPLCGAAATADGNCPDATVDGLLPRIAINEEGAFLTASEGALEIFEDWPLAGNGQPPESGTVRPVPAQAVARLLKDLGHLKAGRVSVEALAAALETADEDPDRLGLGTLSSLLRQLHARRQAPDS